MKNKTQIQIMDDCGFADSMVSYIYNEIDGPERRAFESHLIDCSKCTDEFAELSGARLAVFEWNKEEFLDLPSPRLFNPAAAASSGGSFAAFLDGLRGLLTPLTAAAAMGALVITAAFAFYLSSNNGSGQIAGNTRPEIPAIAAEPKDEIQAAAPTPIAREPELPNKQELSVTPASPLRADVRMKQPKVRQEIARTQKSVPRNTTEAKTPVLSSFKEPVDKSLRLADLFDDIGG